MKGKPNLKAFEHVKDQIGCCGIWCGSCAVGNGVLRELTKASSETIEAYGVQKWGPKDFDFKEFLQGLTSIQSMPLCPGCLQGGGQDNCVMKACAVERDIDDCTTCNEFGRCEHTDALRKMRSGALGAGLVVKNTSDDRQQIIEKWIDELKNDWPCCILFMNDR